MTRVVKSRVPIGTWLTLIFMPKRLLKASISCGITAPSGVLLHRFSSASFLASARTRSKLTGWASNGAVMTTTDRSAKKKFRGQSTALPKFEICRQPVPNGAQEIRLRNLRHILYVASGQAGVNLRAGNPKNTTGFAKFKNEVPSDDSSVPGILEFTQTAQHLLRRNRQSCDSHADCLVDGIA